MRILIPIDILIAVAGVLASFTYRIGLPDYYMYSLAAIAMIAFSVLTKIPIFYLLGFYQPRQPGSFHPVFLKILAGVTMSSLLTSAGMLTITGDMAGFPRTALAIDWLINIFGLVLVRWLAQVFIRNQDYRTLSPVATPKENWKSRGKEAALYYGILGAVLGSYLLWNRIFIGSAFPVSGEIKRWWGVFASRVYGGSARNQLSFWGVGFHNDFDAWRPFSFVLQSWSREIADWQNSYKPELFYPAVLILCCLIALGILYLNRNLALRGGFQLALPVLWIGSFSQIVSYNLTGYAGMKEWYWISQPVFLVLAGSLLFAILIKPLQKIRFANLVLLISAIVAGLVMARDFGTWIRDRMPHGYFSSDLPYMDSASFLEKNTPPGAVIGMTGGGNVGYYIRGRTIVNMDGLINSPGYFEALQAGLASAYLTDIGVDFIFANPEILNGPPYRGQYNTGEVLVPYGGKALMELLP
jgi:hypothetical protein